MSKAMDIIDINEKKGFPRKYYFNQFIRWFTIILAIGAIVYAFWTIFYKIDAESSKFIKIAPFVIIFFAANSLIRNLTSINIVTFTEKAISFSFLIKKRVTINWADFRKMSYGEGRQRVVFIEYDNNGEPAKFQMSLAFPKMLEILNSIAEICPDIEYDEFLDKIIISRVINRSKK